MLVIGFLVAALLPVLMVGTAAAQTPDCSAPRTQAAMNACTALDLDEAERELYRVSRTVGSTVPPDMRQGLIAAQDAWRAYRDAQCRFEGSRVAGGSLEPMVVGNCQTDLTRMQIERLSHQKNCEEGDVSCITR